MNRFLQFAKAIEYMDSEEIKAYFDSRIHNCGEVGDDDDMPEFSSEKEVIRYLNDNGIYNFSTTEEIFKRVEERLFKKQYLCRKI